MNDYLLDHDDPGDFLGKENDYYKKGKDSYYKIGELEKRLENIVK